MRRIAVIGNGGGGTSTVAHALSRRLGLPLNELVTKSGRAARLVHLRSPGEMAGWLGGVTSATAEVAD